MYKFIKMLPDFPYLPHSITTYELLHTHIYTHIDTHKHAYVVVYICMGMYRVTTVRWQ